MEHVLRKDFNPLRVVEWSGLVRDSERSRRFWTIDTTCSSRSQDLSWNGMRGHVRLEDGKSQVLQSQHGFRTNCGAEPIIAEESRSCLRITQYGSFFSVEKPW